MLISTASTLASSFSSARVRTVAIGANRRVPQPAGTAITWTAAPIGGEAPYQYKWLVYNGSEWDVAQNWSDSNLFTWKPAFGNPLYRVAVWVRGFGNTSDAFEATTESAFAIEAAASALATTSLPPPARPMKSAPVSPVSTVILAVDLSSPQPPGATITWTAIATGGGARREFKWFVYDGRRWTTAAPWSTDDTFSWTPATPNPRCRIAVWARSAGSTRDYFEASADAGFAIDSRRAKAAPASHRASANSPS
jgi:hypothetical protein